MNETKKTGIFWAIAVATALLAAIVAWPTTSSEEEGGYADFIGNPLFPKFKDPLTASSLKIVTFDDAQGTLENFEVLKDAQSGLWTIKSKKGYPADAVEQMKDAANSLVDLKVLDVPTDNAEDHAGMGVVEPELEKLNVGDEGVGQLVTFKDEAQNDLASLIIGDPVKGQEGQVYVRIPRQDPVYVVSLDSTPLTTKFESWIEEDLLQLSSIDLAKVEVKDYNASLGLQGVSLTRNYNAQVAKEGADWVLESLKEFDKTNPLADPTEVSVDPSKKLNSQKLNDLSNALDDLKFVDVLRKPDGISASLKADEDFSSDQEASAQLATRGFIPVPMGPNREIEILSANGELTATTKDGVQYILRFGNISGIADDDDSENEDQDADSQGGVNRYLMVSTVVDDSSFPPPELKPIPQTLEELEAMENPQKDEPSSQEETEEAPMKDDSDGASEEEGESEAADAKETEAKDEKDPAESGDEGDSDKESGDSKEEMKQDDAEEDSAKKESSSEAEEGSSESGETDASGEGEESAVGEAQEEEGDSEEGSDTDAPSESDSENGAKDEGSSDSESETSEDESELTEEEKLEKLAAIQEKITKENERLVEARKENIEQAKRRSQELNERFADWYYVIPEATYAKLRFNRDELFESSAVPSAPNAAAPPNFNFNLPTGN